ncbi:condensation protein [Actinosynnema pretiosum subsp. pretiosum]|uniref:Phthiocerol/phthiodiolone dimycocerosyl transferase n=2 Tax=Actinosynnema TaxID=40566 RepID=C6WEG0_ACTMD|nr:condensation domain-containing protein [Actinosynnema mirum]ACU37760.1 condensation domain protein [Actinosynnema mirum DSM 43827]AXX31235.1 Malonyl CoA-acyl carrier protein transacylase [Actinosynnema pretiosum subsp. pretiosum]QUF04694.1 condensation protein [Actinosynnema pretiosum subsp. pretiosum]
MERPLAAHEAAVQTGQVRLVLWSDLEGEPDESAFDAALAHLVGRYPLLAGRITDHGNRQVVHVEEPPGAVALGRGTSLDEEINAAHTWTRGPLLRATLLREATGARLVMTLPRAFSDGMSYLALHKCFWAAYTALRTGVPATAEPVHPVLGPSIDDRVAELFTQGQLDDFVAERARLDAQESVATLPTTAAANGGPGPDATLATVRITIDPDRSRALTALAHEESLTTNDLVSGVLLTALRRCLPQREGTVRVVCTSAVDLRRRLTPPIPDEVLQSAATTTSMRLDLHADDTPLRTARHAREQLRAAVDNGDATKELATFAHVIDQHPPSLVITNVGAIAEPDLPDGLRVTDVRLAPLGHLPMLFVVVSRYRGRIQLTIDHSRAWHTAQQVDEFADHVTAVLAELR